MRTVEKRKRDDLKPDPGQPRKHFTPELLLKMGKSLLVKQIVPLLIRADNTIIDGEQRWQAAGMVGLEWLDVIVAEGELTNTEIKLIQLTSAMMRADLTAPEQTNACAELLQLNPTWNNKALAEHLHVDPSTVTRLLAPLKCIDAVQSAYRAGKLNLSEAYEFFKLTAEDQAAVLARKLAGDIKGRDALAAHGRKVRSGTPPVEGVKRIKLELASGVTVVFSAEAGLSLETAHAAATEAGKEIKRGMSEGWSPRTLAKATAERAKAGA